ncbi:aldo/keto reductase, partial [Planctomycetota bacterium]
MLDKEVLRLGIAGNMGLTSDDVLWAADRGAGYWLWGLGFGRITEGLREVLARDRDAHVVAMLGMALFGWQVRWSVERALRKLGTEYLDVFKLGWLGRTSRYADSILDTLLALKEEGKIRAIGTSIHDRLRAGRLVRESPIDVFMIRYNAKHPGAEQDIFPHLHHRSPAVVSYTATSWRQLLRPIKGLEMPPWPGEGALDVPPLTPGLCYRFVLSSPHVHVALSGAGNRDQLRENLEALRQGQ